MESRSSLTEIVYIWYKNREFLYEDWSPWYQQLVSSEEAVTYSCAVKGHEHLRAPEVSVDSVTSTCFNVTYAKGRMCSYKQTSVDEPCSITYPREVYVQRTPAGSHVILTCHTSCLLTAHQTAYKGYKNRHAVESFSCAVKGLEDLRSAEVCIKGNNCWSVNYVSRRICASEGSSANISSEYSYPENQHLKSKFWYKIKRVGTKAVEKLTEDAGRVEYHENRENQHTLKIRNLNKNDSAEYIFRVITNEGGWKQSGFSVVKLTVTGLKVKFTPSAVVTEDQRVTLTCSTSCPLTDDTNYIWFFNSRPLTLTGSQNKHLILDPVNSLHAGNYSCAVKTQRDFTSPEEALTVQASGKSMAIINAVRLTVALLIVIPLLFHLWLSIWT
ncbi:carcinoembryonic antigen-related cell adhesion molecule 21-like [Plectropomus leopardus]|uniref:carcinoembryonic antigen-related cell adhesion molecule 21-like n=1 Tax=Plectropomus leopardus TaxID=160734 RepID=UPI001C4C0AB2|nr:carcinoembryonic antigen-related cell adhesion molecule 21-like [Plectropomus leopardus]